MVKFLRNLLNLELELGDEFYTLRCWECGRLSLGCPEHWFCGLCTACYDWQQFELDHDDLA